MKFYDAKKVLPDYSTICIVFTTDGNIMELTYSAKYKKFNVWDFFDEKKVERVSIEVTFWVYREEFLQEVEYA